MILEEEYIEGAEDATQVKLRQLGLSVGEQFEMDYDYGCTQVFKIRLDAVRDMENGRGTHYPYITDGRGARNTGRCPCGRIRRNYQKDRR